MAVLKQLEEKEELKLVKRVDDDSSDSFLTGGRQEPHLLDRCRSHGLGWRRWLEVFQASEGTWMSCVGVCLFISG